MSEISNKTLVGLLVVAIVISLAGTFISLNKLGQLRSITGFQANVTTQQGTTSAQILGTAQITLYNTSMNFGAGQVNGTYTVGHDFCHLVSKGDQVSAGNSFAGSGLGAGSISAECVGAGWLTPWSFVLENTGNTDFTTGVTMGTGGGNDAFKANFTSAVADGNWSYIMAEEAASACDANLTTAFTLVPAAAANVCGAFQSEGANDAFLVQMEIYLPEDAAAAAWSDTVTFTATV